MTRLRALCLGELPLGEAFWTWAITVGLLVNVTTSMLFLAMITMDRPWAALRLATDVGALQRLGRGRRLRSAARHAGSAGPADLARMVRQRGRRLRIGVGR